MSNLNKHDTGSDKLIFICISCCVFYLIIRKHSCLSDRCVEPETGQKCMSCSYLIKNKTTFVCFKKGDVLEFLNISIK